MPPVHKRLHIHLDTTWRTGTFSGEDALVTLGLVIMVWFAFRFVGIPLGGSLLALAYIAYSLEGR
jgi:hypothetical protein